MAHPLACSRMLPMHEAGVHDKVLEVLEPLCLRAGWTVQRKVATIFGRRLDAVVGATSWGVTLGLDARITATTTPANVAREDAGGDPLRVAEFEKLADGGQGGAARRQRQVMAPVVLSVAGGMGDATRVFVSQLTLALEAWGWRAGHRAWEAGPSVAARMVQAMAEGLVVKVRRWRAASIAATLGASRGEVDEIILGRRADG